LVAARKRLRHLFPVLPKRPGYQSHGARTLHGLRTRICSRFLALAAAISLNHRLGRPPRALADYTA
jgi:hypothetical protein